jgi:hypothetical protein
VAPRYPTSARTRSPRTFFFCRATETDTRRAPTCSPKTTNSEAFLATLDRGVSAAARGRREKSRPGAISRDREPRTRRQRLPFFRATTSRDGGISGGVAAPRAHHAARDPTRAPPPRRRAPRVTQGRRDGPFRRARATVRLEPAPGPIRARAVRPDFKRPTAPGGIGMAR